MAVSIRGSNPHETFKFNGGEIHVRLKDPYHHQKHFRLDARLNSADDIMELVLLSNALRVENPTATQELFMPYVPYARQDRVCNPGEALSIKAFAQIINALNFTTVTTLDNHSDVATALIDNCENLSMDMWLDELSTLTCEFANHEFRETQYVLVAPDAGAMKKTLKLAQRYWGLRVITCDKQRDTKTGDIVGTVVHWGYSMKKMNLLIVDDICDGGRTFIEIAKAVEKFKPASIELAVTHGIFSKGTLPLFDSGISRIYTTDSFPQEVDSRVSVVNL